MDLWSLQYVSKRYIDPEMMKVVVQKADRISLRIGAGPKTRKCVDNTLSAAAPCGSYCGFGAPALLE